MKPEQTVCHASVWPHRHTNELTGPLDIVISYRNQPKVLKNWTNKPPIKVFIVQPDERTNLTIIHLAANINLVDDENWTNINQCRVRDNGLKFYLKSRITRKMEHPIPRGKWTGTCDFTDSWFSFTFQAMTMRVEAKKSVIVLPDGSNAMTPLPAESGQKTRIVLP